MRRRVEAVDDWAQATYLLKRFSCLRLFALSILMKLNPGAEYVDAYPQEIKANTRDGRSDESMRRRTGDATSCVLLSDEYCVRLLHPHCLISLISLYDSDGRPPLCSVPSLVTGVCVSVHSASDC